MNRNKTGLLVTAVIGFAMALPVAMAPVAAAKCPDSPESKSGAYCCGNSETSFDFGDLCKDANSSPATAVLLYAINFLAIGVGIAVLGGIIWGGTMYIMSDGSPEKSKQGRDIVLNSVIGLIMFIILYMAINFIVPGGVFR